MIRHVYKINNSWFDNINWKKTFSTHTAKELFLIIYSVPESKYRGPEKYS